MDMANRTTETPSYGIRSWPDNKALMDQFKVLLAQPPRGISKAHMPKVLDYFEQKCQTSKAWAKRASEVIPGGVQHNLAFNHPFPIAATKVDGAYMWDADGNRYIDFLQAGGPTLLGSNYRPVREKAHQIIDECGPVTGLLHEYEFKLAEIIRQYMPGIEMFRMLGSGTEACMGAIRLARAHTGKKWVIKVGGDYHGWSDQMVYGMRVPGTGRREATGIPKGVTSCTQEVFPNELGTLRRKLMLNRIRGGTAAVIVEPLGPESGTRPVTAEYNREVRKLCDEFGALLIFDEVVSGFRVGMGGAQGYFNVNPDITVFGKCLTGGYLMAGGIGGRKEVMMTLVGGIGTSSKRAFVGGTLSANPLSCVAGYYAIEEMARTNAPIVAGRAGDRLAAGLKEILNRLGLPFVVYNMGSIVHLQTSAVLLMSMRTPIKLMREANARKHVMEEMGAAYLAHGLLTLAGSRIYTSMADTDEVIDDALNRFESVFRLV
jgi:glutamate-1-semialdehyde 2,1-aminomutase